MINADGGRELSADQQAVITSLLSAGTFFGALGQSFTADSLGRRGSILLWSIIVSPRHVHVLIIQFTIGVVVQTSSFGIPQLAAGRCIAGFGVGALSAIVPLYIGEAAPKRLRGSLLVLYQVQIASGIFLAYIVDLGTHGLSSAASWRVPIGLQLVCGIVLIVGALALPESPRHLLGKGQDERALAAIARLNDCSVEDPLTQQVVTELGEAVREENEGGKAGWLECFGWSNNSKLYAFAELTISVEANDERYDDPIPAAAQVSGHPEDANDH